MRFFCLIYIVMIMLLAGCDQADMLKNMTPPEAESAARGYIDLLKQNKFEEIEKDLDSSIKTADIRDSLVEMAQMIPAQKPESIKVVGAHVNVFHGPKDPETTTTDITLEYQFQSKWLLINVATQKKGGVSTVVGFNVNPIPDSLENLNKFKLGGKSPLQYSVLFLAILIPLFTLFALIQCFRTKIEKRKWLWLIFIMLGLARLSIDWTTGQWAINPVNVLFLGAGAFAPLYGSWVISISLPLGAIIFMLKRKGLSKRQNNTAQIVQPEPEKED
jgi:hypothetical protein